MKVVGLVIVAFCLTACATTHRTQTASPRTTTATTAPAPAMAGTLSGLNSEPGIAVSGGVVGEMSVGNSGR